MKTHIDIKEESILDFTERAMSVYGSYVNNSRHMPHRLDGLKPAYRRMIWTALEHPDKLTKVATLAGVCGGKYSPHAPESLPSVVSEMVQAKIFNGQGAHGSNSIDKSWNIPSAAARYIEAKLDKNWRDLISPLIKLVPKVESELNFMEPTYIPTPIPIGLLMGSLGLGIGVKSTLPNFSPKSLLSAYESNNPNKLEANGDLKIDYSRSELDSLWNQGSGRVCYEFDISDVVTIAGETGFEIYGDPTFIQTTLTSKLKTKLVDGVKSDKEEDLGWIDRGLVKMLDRSSKKTGKRIFFSIKKNQKGSDRVTLEMLREELESYRLNSTKYTLSVTDGTTTEVLPLKLWLDICYKNFEKLVGDYKKSKLDSIQMKVHVANYAKSIVDLIRANDVITKEEIATKLKISKDIVEEATKKSISVLMKYNKEKELESLKHEAEKINKLKPIDFYGDIIN